MRSLLVGVVVFLASLALSIAMKSELQQPVSFLGQQVVRFEISHEKERVEVDRWIDANSFDVWARHPRWVDVRLPTLMLAEATSNVGVPLRILSPDLQKDIERERLSLKVPLPLQFDDCKNELKNFLGTRLGTEVLPPSSTTTAR